METCVCCGAAAVCTIEGDHFLAGCSWRACDACAAHIYTLSALATAQQERMRELALPYRLGDAEDALLALLGVDKATLALPYGSLLGRTALPFEEALRSLEN